MEIFRVLAGILHIGNVMFQENEDEPETCFIPVRSLSIIINRFYADKLGWGKATDW